MARDDSPRINGVKAFGDNASFACSILAVTPQDIDQFLGNNPGTTEYGAPVAYAISGRFYGQTQTDVQASIDALSGFVGASVTFGYPTGLRFPADYRWTKHPCYFVSAEFVPSSIQSYPGNTYYATYKMVLRQLESHS